MGRVIILYPLCMSMISVIMSNGCLTIWMKVKLKDSMLFLLIRILYRRLKLYKLCFKVCMHLYIDSGYKK